MLYRKMEYLETMELRQKNRTALFFAIGIAAIVVIMVTMVWPFWNLIPQYVTEKVKVVSIDQNGCYADTSDNYLVKLTGCTNAKVGDYIMGTYDVKIKQRQGIYLP